MRDERWEMRDERFMKLKMRGEPYEIRDLLYYEVVIHNYDGLLENDS